MRKIVLAIALGLAFAAVGQEFVPVAATERSDIAAASSTLPSVTVPLPGRPFGVVPSPDGRWVFVSVTEPFPLQDIRGPADTSLKQLGSLVVLENANGQIKIHRILPMANRPFGMTLTRDGKLLIVAAQGSQGAGSVIFFDADRLVSGDANPRHFVAPNAAYISEGPGAGSIYANVTADDKTLFVSNESSNTIAVIDLESLRARGLTPAAQLGRIPVGASPIALTFSADGRWLYTTSEIAPPSFGWPRTLRREGGGPGMVSEGAVIVIDVEKARIDPANSIVARVPAGGSPVRLALSPDGNRLFVTARASDAVLVFDAAKLISDPQNARLSAIPVGKSPVPIALVQNGSLAVVGISDRFGADATKPSILSVLDTTRIGKSNPIIGSVPAGAFPRELSLSPDGKILYWTNFLSRSLQAITVDQLSR